MPKRRGLWLGALLGLLALAASAADGEAQAFLLLYDTSGSLRPEDLDAAREVGRALMGRLGPASQIGVLRFDDSAELLAPLGQPPAAEAALSGLRRAGRHTTLHDALFLGVKLLQDAPAAKKAIILFTDGVDESTSVLEPDDIIDRARQSGVAVFAIGVGSKLDEALLRRLAQETNGAYYDVAWLALPADLAADVLRALEPARLEPAEARPAAPPAVEPAAATPRPGPERLASAVTPRPSVRPERSASAWDQALDRTRALTAEHPAWLMALAGVLALILWFAARSLKRRPATQPPVLQGAENESLDVTVVASSAPIGAAEGSLGWSEPEAAAPPAAPARAAPADGVATAALSLAARLPPRDGPPTDPPSKLVADPGATQKAYLDDTLIVRGDTSSPIDLGERMFSSTLVLVDRPILVRIQGGQRGEAYELRLNGVTTIGRSQDNDIRVADEAVSGHHCHIEGEGMVCTLVDRHSTNGSYVNGERVEAERFLEPGNVVRIGETEFVFDKQRRRS